MELYVQILYTFCFTTYVSSFPFRVSPVVSGKCTSMLHKELLFDSVNKILDDVWEPPGCTCGRIRSWKRVAYLNITDENTHCPGNWSKIESPVRACIGNSSGCSSAFFSTEKFTYNHVCGKVLGYQQGSPDGFNFWDGIPKMTLEGTYLNGLSLTYGATGSRQHIWSFVAALYETNTLYYPHPNCQCTNTNSYWPFEVPAFVGKNSYFCDSGNPGPGYNDSVHYTDDPLWDGSGCSSTSTCCQLNNPPWFCTSLPEATNEDLELRICTDDRGEDIDVYFVEIYVSLQ